MEEKAQKLQELQAQRERTQMEIDRLQEQVRAEIEPASSGDEDLVDAAADIYERSKMLSLIQRLEEKLEKLDRAIESVGQDRYGICEECGEAIPPERLEVMPETTLCVKCAAKLEVKNRVGKLPVRPIDWSS